MSERTPQERDTKLILEEIDELLRQQSELREQIDEAQDSELRPRLRVDRRQRERRTGRDRRAPG
jgi:hypothetical protein